MKTTRLVGMICLLAAIPAGCAQTSWDEARAQDSVAAYRRYIAENPRSKHSLEARERLAVIELDREPGLAALDSFRKEFPASPALPQLVERVAAAEFERARAAGTTDAYARFEAAFPATSLATRAAGNRAFLESGGFPRDPAALRAFAAAHPSSDYALEAQRLIQASEARAGSRFRRVGLEIVIASDVPEADRIRSLFAEKARKAYASAGLSIVEGEHDAATLRIEHSERSVAAGDGGEVFARPGVIAETRVALESPGASRPEFDDSFTWRVSNTDLRPGGSVLFSKSAAPYWDRFFVPIATWPTSKALRSSWPSESPLSGVGLEAGHGLLVSDRGSLRELDLTDPSQPRVARRYDRGGVAARYAGATKLGDRTILFGDDGIEVVVETPSGLRNVAAWDRGAVGAVSGVAQVGERVVAAGTRGLVNVPIEGGTVERLIERPLRGIARVGDTLLLLDAQWIYAGPVADLRAQSFFTAADVGRALDPQRLRADGSLAVVVGRNGVAVFALAERGAATPLTRLRTSEIGAVADAALANGSLFILGERGLLVADPRSGRVLDSIDVEGREAMAARGTRILTIGNGRVDVIDASPWAPEASPASMAR